MKRLFTYLLAAILFIACTQSEIDIVYRPEASDINLNIGFETDDTRIQLDQAGKSVWNMNDHVSVFYKSEDNQEWRYQGQTGDRTGVIAPIGSVKAPSISGNIVVVYPYDINNAYSTQTNRVAATVAQEQQYTTNSYGSNGNILIAQSTTNNLSLKNVYGWLKVSLTGDGQTVKSITLTGNNDEQLAGNILINAEDATAEFADTDSPIKSIKLNCDKGIALSTTPTSFYIGVIPQTFESGITIEIEGSNGAKMTKSTSKEITISRRHILPMKTFELATEVFYPNNNQVWYYTNSGDKLAISSSPCDADIVTHEFGVCIDEQCRNLYYIDFNKDVTTVNAMAFLHSDLQTIYLPNSITTIGQSAFLGSQNIKTIHIGNGVTDIKMGAFTNCSRLEELYIRATTPPSLGEYALNRDSTRNYAYIGCLIYVPVSAVEAYKSHPNWSRYADYICGYDFVAGKVPGANEGEGGDSTPSQFNHRLLLVDHTGVNCGFCPQMIDRLYALENSEYKDYYNEVTVHGGSYAPSYYDPAYSYAASVVDDFYIPNGYPALHLNYHGGKINRYSDNDLFLTNIGAIFNTNRQKLGADAGIAISTTANATNLYIDVDVKSAKAQTYYVAVWVLENNIASPNQNGATLDRHKVANHALRYIASDYSSSYMLGDSLGVLTVNQVAEKSYTVPINSNWVVNNLEVLVIVSDDTDVVNTAVCPINATKDYEYLVDLINSHNDDSSDDNSGGGSGNDDQQESQPITPPTPDQYGIGSLYDNGDVKGVIFAIKDFPVYNDTYTEVIRTDKYCYIFSLDEEDLQWSTKYEWCNCTSQRGEYNSSDPFNYWGQDINDYPAFKWCKEHGDGWFLPSSNELNWMWETITDGARDFTAPSVAQYNKLITDNGGEPFVETYYWSSNETTDELIEVVAFMNDSIVCLDPKKDSIFTARAVYRFKVE